MMYDKERSAVANIRLWSLLEGNVRSRKVSGGKKMFMFRQNRTQEDQFVLTPYSMLFVQRIHTDITVMSTNLEHEKQHHILRLQWLSGQCSSLKILRLWVWDQLVSKWAFGVEQLANILCKLWWPLQMDN